MSDIPYPSFKKPDREWVNYLLLAIVFLCGFVIRYAGIDYDFPYTNHWEETVILHNALNILKTGNFHPGFMGYPGLSIYLNVFAYILNYFYAISQGLLTSMAEVRMDQAFAYLSHPSFHLAGRLLNVILGSLCIIFTFKLGEKFHSMRVGLMAALFLAFSFSHVEESRLIHPDVLTGLMAAITLLESFYIMELGRRKFYLLAGFFAGLTVASKYNAFFIVLPLFFAHLLSDKKSHFFNTDFFLMILFVGLGYTIAAPYTFLDLPGFLHWSGVTLLYYNRIGYGNGAGGIPGWPQVLHYLEYLYNSGLGGLVLTVSALAGIVLGFIRQWKKQLMFLSFPGVYFLFMCMQKINFTKNMIPILPFMAVMGALTLAMLMDLLIWYFPQVTKIRPLILAVAALGLIYPSAAKCIEHIQKKSDYLDSRSVTVEWLRKNVPAEELVAIIKEARFFNNDLENLSFRVDWFAQAEHFYSWYRKNGYRYIVTSTRYDFRYKDPLNEKRHKQANNYNTFFSGVQVIKRFGDNSLHLDSYSQNPVITVLQVNPL